MKRCSNAPKLLSVTPSAVPTGSSEGEFPWGSVGVVDGVRRGRHQFPMNRGLAPRRQHRRGGDATGKRTIAKTPSSVRTPGGCETDGVCKRGKQREGKPAATSAGRPTWRLPTDPASGG